MIQKIVEMIGFGISIYWNIFIVVMVIVGIKKGIESLQLMPAPERNKTIWEICVLIALIVGIGWAIATSSDNYSRNHPDADEPEVCIHAWC